MEKKEKPNNSLYKKVKNEIILQIKNRTWEIGDPIPTEKELMEIFNVSRTTLRHSIMLLSNEGFLEKIQGKGTFVKNHTHLENVGKLYGFSEEARRRNLKPSSKTIKIERGKNFFLQKSKLDLNHDDEVIIIERVRFMDNIPVSIETSCWPLDIGQIFLDKDLDTLDFYQELEKNGIYLKSATEQIKAINSTKLESKLLGIDLETALLETTRLCYDHKDRKIEFTKTKYVSDYYRYEVNLVR